LLKRFGRAVFDKRKTGQNMAEVVGAHFSKRLQLS
jgi:hypothetical protein